MKYYFTLIKYSHKALIQDFLSTFSPGLSLWGGARRVRKVGEEGENDEDNELGVMMNNWEEIQSSWI